MKQSGAQSAPGKFQWYSGSKNSTNYREMQPDARSAPGKVEGGGIVGPKATQNYRKMTQSGARSAPGDPEVFGAHEAAKPEGNEAIRRAKRAVFLGKFGSKSNAI